VASSKTVGVIGAGTMGSGIAQVCALSAFPVAMIDVDATSIARGRNGISAGC
jgi:3-hydroxybutyryl-CoA dehydrogenase